MNPEYALWWEELVEALINSGSIASCERHKLNRNSWKFYYDDGMTIDEVIQLEFGL